jgi:hypothetical protein
MIGSCSVGSHVLSANYNDSWCHTPFIQLLNGTGSIVVSACLEPVGSCYTQSVVVEESSTFVQKVQVTPLASAEYAVYNSAGSLLCETSNLECTSGALTVEIIVTSECYGGLGISFDRTFAVCLVPMNNGTYRQSVSANHVDEIDNLTVCKGVPAVSSARRTVSFWW